jgi:DNA-binding NarL/FixJ family response regulator
MKRAKVLLADDHALILDGFRLVLESEYEIVGAVNDGQALVDAAIAEKPDIIILDVTMPVLNGIHAARQIRRAVPEAKLLFVTMHANPAYLREALNAGGSGYVLKTSAREEIVSAVHKVLKGEVYITPAMEGVSTARESNTLTVRQLEILKLIAEGLTAKEISTRLSISTKTVAFHRERIKRRLGLQTTAQLTRHAIEEGLA